MTRLSPADLLALYDAQLRDEGELDNADGWERHGPVLWAVIDGSRGFVTYRDLGGLDPTGIGRLVSETAARFRDDLRISQVEWKARGHDAAPGLHEALVCHGFVQGDVESVMIGEATALAADVPVPEGVAVRRVTAEDDVRRMCACAEEAFGRSAPGMSDSLLRRQALGKDDFEMWVAEVDDEVVSTGRLTLVPGTDFAGLWGGSTLERWRGRGIYRALTAERAKSAVRRGVRLLQSDSTEDSRPILERSGFVKVTTTTPYEWVRPDAVG
ncbi:GNAT family N-acetyltransferase [Mariniluteicoccus flavus]